MAFPPSLTLKTVVAHYTDFVTDPTGWRFVGGRLELKCPVMLRIPADNTFIGPFTLAADFDPDTGLATIPNVPVGDDPDLSAPFDYQVTLKMNGKPPQRFRVAIETSDPATVQLADKPVTVTPIQGAAYALLNGANTFTANNTFTQPVTIPDEPLQPDHAASAAYVLERIEELNELVMHLAGDELATGTKTFQKLRVTMADLINVGFILEQPNTVVSVDDADGFQLVYEGHPRIWGNEKINLRLRRSGNEIPFRLYLDPLDGSTPTAWGFEIIGMGGTTVARGGPNGTIYHQGNDRSDWTDLTGFTGVFSAYVPDINGDKPQYRIVDNGGKVETSGQIVVSAAAATDATILTGLSTALTMLGMGGTKTTRPTRRRLLAGGSQATGAQRIRATPGGELQIVGTIASATVLSLDGLSWRI